MGKIIDSIISGTSGRIGRVVVARVNGVEILRVRPQKTQKPSTDKQELIKTRFNTAVIFMQSYKEHAKKFYGIKKGMKSCYNFAMSNVMNALYCDMTNLEIIPNYSQIQFSKGVGLRPYPTAMSSPQALEIKIDWENNADGTAAKDDTLLVLLAEDNDLTADTLFYSTTATRKEESHSVTLLPRYQGKQMHVWVAFQDASNQYASDSVYIGSVSVT